MSNRMDRRSGTKAGSGAAKTGSGCPIYGLVRRTVERCSPTADMYNLPRFRRCFCSAFPCRWEEPCGRPPPGSARWVRSRSEPASTEVGWTTLSSTGTAAVRHRRALIPEGRSDDRRTGRAGPDFLLLREQRGIERCGTGAGDEQEETAHELRVLRSDLVQDRPETDLRGNRGRRKR